MRAIKPNTRRRPLSRTVLLTGMAIVIGGAGTVALLGATRVIDLGKLAFWREREKPIPADWVAIPRCAKPIERYTKITMEYLTNPLTVRWFVTYVPPDKVPTGVVLDPNKILFRVTAFEKRAGLFFSEADFLPPGTRPGVVGGTPEGKRAITLDAAKLKGVQELREGDHVDLLASIPIDMPGTGRSNSGRMGASVVASPDVALLPKRSLVRPVVEDGVVVTPAKIRNMPTSSSSLTQGTTTRTIPVQEIVLAVEPQEVAPLAEAMDLKYEITCVARSGRPTPAATSAARSESSGGFSNVFAALAKSVLGAHVPAAPGKAAPSAGGVKGVSPPKRETSGGRPVAMDDTPGLDPMAQVRFMEVMIGTQRQFVLFSGPGNSPVVAAQDDGSAKPAEGALPAAASEQNE